MDMKLTLEINKNLMEEFKVLHEYNMEHSNRLSEIRENIKCMILLLQALK